MSEGKLVAGGASLICLVRASVGVGVDVVACEEFVKGEFGVMTETCAVSFEVGSGSVVGTCVSTDWRAGGDNNSGR